MKAEKLGERRRIFEPKRTLNRLIKLRTIEGTKEIKFRARQNPWVVSLSCRRAAARVPEEKGWRRRRSRSSVLVKLFEIGALT
ncbi:hypothetical protein CEXT_24351 [Caerostris extrusa]|uniref:Uncharacterized protein n=1 Tax=Caerostris extrusa TaxID=172846 RepID=A0AAV4RP38_CAEEX|nr:hypothetical protein CEXT_24351 [Caerostris extrusa]